MATLFSTLMKTTPAWLSAAGEMGDVVLATLGRLVRNLPHEPFPGWSNEASRRRVVEALLPTLLARPGFKSAFHADMTELSLTQRRALMERKLITPCMAARQAGCHLIIPRRQDVTVMLNEEEHLVAHFLQQGLNLNNVLTDMQRFAAALQNDIEFAHDAAHGYLTSLPAEAGEGMQLYVVLHLPGLVLANMTDQISRGLEKLQLNMAPYNTGLQEDTGNTFIIFTNAIAPGKSREVMSALEELIHTLALREIQVRAKLCHTKTLELADRLGRAFGMLCYAVRLSYREMLDALSLLRVGTQCGMLHWEIPEEEALARLVTLNHSLAPAHLALTHGRKEPEEFHPVIRAMQLKECIMEAGPAFSPPHTQNDPA